VSFIRVELLIQLQFTQLDANRHLLVATIDLHGNRIARALADESITQRSSVGHLFIIDFYDNITCL